MWGTPGHPHTLYEIHVHDHYGSCCPISYCLEFSPSISRMKVRRGRFCQPQQLLESLWHLELLLVEFCSVWKRWACMISAQPTIKVLTLLLLYGWTGTGIVPIGFKFLMKDEPSKLSYNVIVKTFPGVLLLPPQGDVEGFLCCHDSCIHPHSHEPLLFRASCSFLCQLWPPVASLWGGAFPTHWQFWGKSAKSMTTTLTHYQFNTRSHITQTHSTSHWCNPPHNTCSS